MGLALANKNRPRKKTNDDTNSGTRLNRLERRLGLVQSERVTGVAVTANRQAKVGGGGWKEGEKMEERDPDRGVQNWMHDAVEPNFQIWP